MFINKCSDIIVVICIRWNIMKENIILMIFIKKKELLLVIIYSVVYVSVYV